MGNNNVGLFVAGIMGEIVLIVTALACGCLLECLFPDSRSAIETILSVLEMFIP
jgi:hypothetical protein